MVQDSKFSCSCTLRFFLLSGQWQVAILGTLFINNSSSLWPYFYRTWYQNKTLICCLETLKVCWMINHSISQVLTWPYQLGSTHACDSIYVWYYHIDVILRITTTKELYCNFFIYMESVALCSILFGLDLFIPILT